MRTIEVFGKEIAVHGSPYTLMMFSEEFDQELTEHLTKAYENAELVPLEAMMRVVWAMAKTADESTASYKVWLCDFPVKKFSLGDYKSLEVIDSAIHAELFRSQKTGFFKRIRNELSRFLVRLSKRIHT